MSVKLWMSIVAVSLATVTAGAETTASAPVPAAASETVVYPLPRDFQLELDVPKGWRRVYASSKGGPPQIILTKGDDLSAGMMLLMPVAYAPDAPADMALSYIKDKAKEAGNATVVPFKDGLGGWFLVRNAEAAEQFGLPFETTLARRPGPYVLDASINAATKDSSFAAQATAMMATARVVASASGAAPMVPIELTLPLEPWSLRFSVPRDMDVQSPDTTADGMKIAGRSASGIMFTAFVETDAPGGTATARRDFMAAHARQLPEAMKPRVVTVSGLRTWEEGGKAFLVYDAAAEGVPGAHRSLNVVMVTKGHWVDVHISQSPTSPESQAIVDAIAASVRFAD